MSLAKSGTLVAFGVGILGLVGVEEINKPFHIYILCVGGFFVAIGVLSLFPSSSSLRRIARISGGKLPLRVVLQVAEQEKLVPTDRVPDFVTWLLDNVRDGTIVLYGEEGSSPSLRAIPPMHFDEYMLVIPPFGTEARTTGPGGGALGDPYAQNCFYNVQTDRGVYRLLREANGR